MKANETSNTVVGAIGGVAAGYVLWLQAFSITDENPAVGQRATAGTLSQGIDQTRSQRVLYQFAQQL
jgi:hypothetical protein